MPLMQRPYIYTNENVFQSIGRKQIFDRHSYSQHSSGKRKKRQKDTKPTGDRLNIDKYSKGNADSQHNSNLKKWAKS